MSTGFGRHLQNLQGVVVQSYSIEKLTQVVSFELDLNLETVVAGKNLDDTVFDLLMWAKSNGRAVELIKALMENRPNVPTLQVVGKAALEYLSAPADTYESPTPYDACLLSAGRVLLDRGELREHLRGLVRDEGRILVVNGDKRSGKSYTLQAIQFVAERQDSHRVVYVNLVEAPDLAPDQLVKTILKRVGRSSSIEALSDESFEQLARTNGGLIDLVRTQSAESAEYWWIVIDGVGQTEVPGATIDLIKELGMSIMTDVTRVRLVLLSWSEPIHQEVDPYVKRETIEPIGPEKVRAFFEQYAEHMRITADPAVIEQVVEKVVSCASEDGDERLFSLSTAVANAARLLTLAPERPPE
jgi:Effector-associated domain 1